MAICAAVVARPLVITGVAALKMTTESCGATHLDCSHDSPLCHRERPIMLLTIGFAVAAEDVRHFQLRATHRAKRLEVFGWFGLDLHRDRARQQIDSMLSRLCWSLCGDILLLWPGCDDRAAAEWCGRRRLVPTSERQKRVEANAA